MASAALAVGAPRPAAAAATRVRAAIIAALIVGIGCRLTVGWSAPLWFDETFTGVIASADGWRGLLYWCRHEVGGPLYYVIVWSWAQVAGTSDTALRLPGAACSLGTLALIWWRGHRDPTVRHWWAAITAVWLPGLLLAAEARCYALLLFLTTAQAILFLRALAAARLGPLFAWSTVTALAALTHYHALVIGGLQGLILLVHHRRDLVRLLPAVLPFVPVAAWMAIHLPFVLAFNQPGVSWIALISVRSLPYVPVLMFGNHPFSYLFFAALMLGVLTLPRPRRLSPEMLLVTSGVLSCAFVLAVGMITPSFVPRYLYAYMPAVLFGAALCARQHLRRRGNALAALLAVGSTVAAADAVPRVTGGFLDGRSDFTFERASAWIGETRPDRLVFFWESDTARLGPNYNLETLGGFFLHRAGQRVPVTLIRPGAKPDPSTAIMTAARGRAGIIWVWGEGLGGVTARAEPRLSTPGRECRDFGHDSMHIYACRPLATHG